MPEIAHLFRTEPRTMTQAAMEAATPRGHYAVFRYKGMLVDVCRVTPDPVEANKLYRDGIKGEGRHARATTHLFARPL